MPALFTSSLICGCRSRTRAATRSTASRSPTSQTSYSPPSSSASARSRSSRRASSTQRQPRARGARASAAPMPLDAPVMTATRRLRGRRLHDVAVAAIAAPAGVRRDAPRSACLPAASRRARRHVADDRGRDAPLRSTVDDRLCRRRRSAPSGRGFVELAATTSRGAGPHAGVPRAGRATSPSAPATPAIVTRREASCSAGCSTPTACDVLRLLVVGGDDGRPCVVLAGIAGACAGSGKTARPVDRVVRRGADSTPR